MKFSEKWLREWVDPPLDTAGLASRLTMAGLEVEAVEAVAPPFSGVVVGRVIEVVPHPKADRLRVCRVDTGEEEPLAIVCGAPNVKAGMLVPTARVGAKLPGGKAIERANLRGVDSHGMLCSAVELGLAESGGGLMALDDDARPGEDLRSSLGLDDVSITLGITPNRGDCLSIEGIAREVAALCGAKSQRPSFSAVAPRIDDARTVELLSPEACPRYLGRVVRDIDPAAATPVWMRERLRRSGFRSHGPVVDVTNYVLLELGQPMHAFDLERLRGGIRVRFARDGEAMHLLDGQQVTLSNDTLVIADDGGPVALAGIMGGQESAVGDRTRSIFFESAFFAPAAIAGRARRLGLQTDSSLRFERGVDPELPLRAMERATELLLRIAGGEPGPVIEVRSTGHFPQRPRIRLRAGRVERLLGCALEADEITGTLERLGMGVHEKAVREWEVTPPSFRFDVAIEPDLVEEVARVRGYDRLAPTRPRAALTLTGTDPARTRIGEARRLLAGRDYHEAITFGFVNEDMQRFFEPDAVAIRLANPISADMAVMRASLWPGLVQAIIHNVKRQQPRLRLFEYGIKFKLQHDVVTEENVLAGVALGRAYDEQWGLPARDVDFFDVKGDLEALLQTIGVNRGCRFVASRHSALHPGQSAKVIDAAGTEIAWIGSLHPGLVTRLDLPHRVIVFEVSFDRLASPSVARFHEPSKFPAIRRDLAIVVDDSIMADEILACVREAAGDLLHGLTLFDIYQGKGVDSGKKSVALGLTFQDFSRTLTDTQIDGLVTAILNGLQQRLGARLRQQ
jgi:phenylalanyl-tRNA synthetase beta chain